MAQDTIRRHRAAVRPGEHPRQGQRRQSTCTILDNALNDSELSAEEHRERVSAATKAVTLGGLQNLVGDLQTGAGP